MNVKRFLIIIGMIPLLVAAQQEDYYEKQYFRYDTHVYDTNIHSLDLHKKGLPLSKPVFRLNSAKKQLMLSFDDFRDKVRDYSYRIIHCTALWEPSEIRRSEYVRGFGEDYIEEYRFSYNTIQPYIHYELVFPQEDMMPLISGNYLLVVYPTNAPDKPVLSARFMIFEEKVGITAEIKQATSPRHMHTKQEVDFTIHPRSLYIANPNRDLKVIVQQNERKDNKIIDIKPLNITQNKLEYNYEDRNLFEGGNEFRYADLKSFKYQSEQVAKIDVFGKENHVYLYPDPSRRTKSYTTVEDINGKRLIKTTEYDDSDIEADYAWVHFTLPQDAPLIDGGIYILGELTNWELNEQSRMKYNYRNKAYETRLYLKQGYYNYMYAFLQNGSDQATLQRFEGSHSETENNYTIYVYYRHPGTLHDKLVAVKEFTSVQ
mgnify:CR=1 FL=1